MTDKKILSINQTCVKISDFGVGSLSLTQTLIKHLYEVMGKNCLIFTHYTLILTNEFFPFEQDIDMHGKQLLPQPAR